MTGDEAARALAREANRLHLEARLVSEVCEYLAPGSKTTFRGTIDAYVALVTFRKECAAEAVDAGDTKVAE